MQCNSQHANLAFWVTIVTLYDFNLRLNIMMWQLVPLPGTKANCISLTFTIWWMEESSTCSSGLVCEVETMVVTMVKGFTHALVEVQDEALLSVYWDPTAENSLCQFSHQLNLFLTTSLASAAFPPYFRNLACFSCTATPTCSFHHQVSGLHWWCLERLQTLVAASSKGFFSFKRTV